MNIKLHTPKSLKKGSGMSSLKQFLLSLLATTVSIALTFGTAAVIDQNKKRKAKREIVMMVFLFMFISFYCYTFLLYTTFSRKYPVRGIHVML